MKYCKECQTDKSLTDFYKRSNRPGVREVCKKCHCAISAARLKTKPPTKEKRRENQAQWRLDHPGYNAMICKEFRKHNPGKVRAWNAIQKAYRKNAVPAWLTLEQKVQIVSLYENCPKGFHVDHIVPIRGTNVRGFHVPWNLQYLSAAENMKKSNKIVQGNQ